MPFPDTFLIVMAYAESMMKRRALYVSYLLRLWQSGDGEETLWRASLECPMTGERQNFASLRSLFAFLDAMTKGMAGQKSDTGDEE